MSSESLVSLPLLKPMSLSLL